MASGCVRLKWPKTNDFLSSSFHYSFFEGMVTEGVGFQVLLVNYTLNIFSYFGT